MGELIKALEKHHNDGIYPFHMPGHKRQAKWIVNPYEYDITEIEGFDDLHNPKEILKKLLDRIKELYGCGKVFILANGSTSGILSAISSVIDYNDKILIARNCHKSVYNAVFLRKGKIEYIYPQIDRDTGINMPITAEQVDKMLMTNPDTKAVVITSPTYEGVISNIDEIAKVTHRYGAILIVDAAHGAHIGLNGGTTIGESKADIVIMSLHKTLPCFTQTAVLCVNNILLYDRIKKYVDMYETSSPSYLFLAGVEACIDYVKQGDRFEEYYSRLFDLRKDFLVLKHLRLFEPDCSYDYSKIVIDTSKTNINGVQLKNLLLNKYGIELEMASGDYVLAMTSCMDTMDGFNRLRKALLEIDTSLVHGKAAEYSGAYPSKKVYEAWECEAMDTELIMLKDASGYVSSEYVYSYPPGIPIVIPGEVITESLIEYLTRCKDSLVEIRGICDKKIRIIQGKFYG